MQSNTTEIFTFDALSLREDACIRGRIRAGSPNVIIPGCALIRNS
jgi:hypothetical protein